MSWASTPRLLPSQRCPNIFSTISDSNHSVRRTAYRQISSGQCEALDGLKYGLISDPARCQFDPAALLREDNDSSNCLMGHCEGGDGPNSFDVIGALASWVKTGGVALLPGLHPTRLIGYARIG